MWGAGSSLRSLLHPSEKRQLPGEQGNPKGCEQQGHPGLDRRKREQVLRVGMELQCRVLNIINSFPALGEETCCCLPLLKPFPPGLQCNSGVWQKAGLFNPFLLGASAH